MKQILLGGLSLFLLGNSCDSSSRNPYSHTKATQPAFKKQCQSGSLNIYRKAGYQPAYQTTYQAAYQTYNNLYGLQEGEVITITGTAVSQCNLPVLYFSCSGHVTSHGSAFTQITCSSGTAGVSKNYHNTYQTTQHYPAWQQGHYPHTTYPSSQTTYPYHNQSWSFQQGTFRITPNNNQFFVNISLTSSYLPCPLVFSCL